MSDSFVDKAGRTRVRKTHCKHGHEFPANARWVTNWKGYDCRWCDACAVIRMRRKRENPAFKANEAAKSQRWRETHPVEYKAAYTREAETKKQILLDARIGGCIKCGEKDPACLDFHHRNGKLDKLGNIGTFRKFGKQRILDEIAKCDVLCANCHRKHHRDERVTAVSL